MRQKLKLALGLAVAVGVIVNVWVVGAAPWPGCCG